MSGGFFQVSELRTGKPKPSLIPRCGECQLYKHCQSPKMPVSGKGLRKILIVGETGGYHEDQQNLQFVGPSGKILKDTLRKFGIDMRVDCWITNSVICRSHTPDGKNRNPSDKEIDYCRPNLIKTINELKPEIIIPLGGSAVKSLIGWLWKEEVGLISRWDGWRIPCQKINSWICPTWHPAHMLYSDNKGEERDNEVRRMLFESHVEAAFKLKGRPWKKIPDYASQVRNILDHEEAAKAIRGFIERGKVVAWDLECNCLKPDSDKAEIHSCSISDGETTIAFPWLGEAVTAMREFLLSDVPKIGHNVKYESRFILRKLGIRVRNWVFCSMIGAHVLDNRGNTKSLKFLAFVMLGMDAYDTHIKPYFQSKGSNEPNRIREANLNKILTYCGCDSILEYKIAKIQAKKLGIVLE